MKKSLKLTLAIVIAVLMVISCATVSVLAAADETNANAGKVARIGAEGVGTYYDSLSAAVSAAKDGDTITVIKDTTVSSQIVINKDVKLSSENGSVISCTVTKAFSMGSGMLTVGGNLEITSTQNIIFIGDGGDFTLEDNAYVHADVRYILDLNKAANIYIKGGKMENYASDKEVGILWLGLEGTTFTMTGGELIQKRANSYALKVAGDADVQINISGGLLQAPYQTITFYGSSTRGDTSFKMTGGAITAPDGDYAIENYKGHVKNLNMEISGGTIHAKGTALHTNTGNNLVITGNAIVKSDTKWVIAWKGGSTGANIEISGNALLTTPAEKAIEVCSNDTYTISGGTVMSETGKVFYVSAATNFTINVTGGTVTSPKHTIFTEKASTGTINVSSGIVEATNGNKAMYLTHSEGNMVEVNVTGGIVSSNTEATYDTYDSATMDGQDAIFVQSNNSAKVTISGGKVSALYGTLNIRRDDCDVTISGDAIVEAKHGYAALLADGNLTISGGTVKADYNTLGFLGGENTFNMTGGSLIATDSLVLTRTAEGVIVNANISDNAKVYSAGKAVAIQSGITLNISGGLFDVANTYKLAEEADVYMFEARVGTLNITGGKFILGGEFASAQFIAHASTNTDGKSNVNGGLFVNLNTANSTLFGTNVNFVSGRAIYGDNVNGIVNGSQSASKNLQVYYGEGDDLYYYFTKFAATDADKNIAMEDGASIRLTEGSSGIRFTTTFAEVEGATYGTIILPARYVVNLSSFTLDELVAKNIPHSNVVATNGIEVVDGVVTIKAAITNILPENYGTAFAAVAYMEVDGVYYYSEFNMFDNARSIDTVAKAALNDTNEEQTEKYAYAVDGGEGVTLYSPYTDTQRTALEGFIVATFNLTRPEGSILMNVGNGAYELYSANVSAAAYNNYKAGIEGAGFIQAL